MEAVRSRDTDAMLAGVIFRQLKLEKASVGIRASCDEPHYS